MRRGVGGYCCRYVELLFCGGVVLCLCFVTSPQLFLSKRIAHRSNLDNAVRISSKYMHRVARDLAIIIRRTEPANSNVQTHNRASNQRHSGRMTHEVTCRCSTITHSCATSCCSCATTLIQLTTATYVLNDETYTMQQQDTGASIQLMHCRT